MQLMLIFGIVFAIGAVAFALQNNVAVTVTIAVWQYEGSLALVLLMALGLGVLITGLLSSPTVIRRQWATARLRRQVTTLETEGIQQQQRINELTMKLERLGRPVDVSEVEPADEKPYVGFQSMLAGEESLKHS